MQISNFFIIPRIKTSKQEQVANILTAINKYAIINKVVNIVKYGALPLTTAQLFAKEPVMRDFCGILVLFLAGLVCVPFALFSFWLALVSYLALVALFLFSSIQMVPASPPHKAILTFLGKRQNIVLDEGWNYVPLHPWMFGLILVKVEKVNDDLNPQEVMTPDNAKLSVSESITWKPGIKDKPESFITFLNSGGEKGVRKIIYDMAEDRTKTWARSNREGPSDWEEAQALKDDVHGVLAKALLGTALGATMGTALEAIDDPDPNNPVPTPTWMRFFDNPQSEPTKYDANPRNGWAFKGVDVAGNVTWNWDGLQAKFDAYPATAKILLKRQISERRERIKEIREGRGEFANESLGITILRFTVNEVKLIGAVADAAEKKEKENRERDAEKVEIKNVSERAAELMAAHPSLTSAQAFEIVQTERGKIAKTIVAVSGAKTDGGSDLLGAAGVVRGKTP